MSLIWVRNFLSGLMCNNEIAALKRNQIIVGTIPDESPGSSYRHGRKDDGKNNDAIYPIREVGPHSSPEELDEIKSRDIAKKLYGPKRQQEEAECIIYTKLGSYKKHAKGHR